MVQDTTTENKMTSSAPVPTLDPRQRGKPVPRRLNLNLSPQAYADAVKLSEETSRTLTELIRLGLGLVKIAVEESRKRNKLIVTTEDGKPLKELVLPGL
jgi:hypothetical protein